MTPSDARRDEYEEGARRLSGWAERHPGATALAVLVQRAEVPRFRHALLACGWRREHQEDSYTDPAGATVRVVTVSAGWTALLGLEWSHVDWVSTMQLPPGGAAFVACLHERDNLRDWRTGRP